MTNNLINDAFYGKQGGGIMALFSQYYCYKNDCPARTPENPYPHAECRFNGGFKLPNGKVVRSAPKTGVKCPYCKCKMTAVANMSEEY